MATTKVKGPCPKCEGKGRLWEYGHVLNGVCFRCNGTGTAMLTPAQKAAAEARAAQKAAEIIRPDDPRIALWATLKAEHSRRLHDGPYSEAKAAACARASEAFFGYHDALPPLHLAAADAIWAAEEAEFDRRKAENDAWETARDLAWSIAYGSDGP